ncbi:hypothetical protein SAMN03080615_03095 [Amphritea atlantica]|uniref:Uncharacterized protein n=1 Tax=Amphritea atlantica TaxID=355243 RepID=A0A1H9JPY3_9GAMM|nr:hypothetical protein [Amphritea atlantica]SEQ88665.1 hypothetical protein SAMN03080615_03095 [Amphritea atlantica]
MSHRQRYTTGYLSALAFAMLLSISGSAIAMQLTDPRSAAVYIIKLRPLINACRQQADASNNLTTLWNSSACRLLLNEEPQFTRAWQLLLPQGNINPLAEVPYSLRKTTIDTYSEYKQLAERIAQLNR